MTQGLRKCRRPPSRHSLSALQLILAGGACYAVGLLFYATDHRVRHGHGHGHGLWRLFVLAGSGCHFYTVLRYMA